MDESKQADLFGSMAIAVGTGGVPKRCGSCGAVKPRSEFARSSRNDGWQSWCRACVAADSRARYAEQKATYKVRNADARKAARADNRAAKAARGCEALRFGFPACDVTEPDLLEWHHLNPEEKSASVSYFVHAGARRRANEERRKCACLCANHHRMVERTKQSEAA